jgi:hypothetical protein
MDQLSSVVLEKNLSENVKNVVRLQGRDVLR